MTKWEQYFEEKIKILATSNRILDIGGGGMPMGKQLATYKRLFEGKEYIVLDKHPKSKDVIQGDAHRVPFLDESFDAVICKSVLEHVENPFQVVSEIYRVLKSDGVAIVYVPFLFPYHAKRGFYADYWRFTGDGVKLLFKDFSSVEMVNVRGFCETLIHFLPFFRHWLWPLGRFLDHLRPAKNQTSGFTVFVKK